MLTSSVAVCVLTVTLLPAQPCQALNPIGLLLDAESAARRVGEYLGLIESLDSKVDKLLDADMKTGVALFEQARANPQKTEELVEKARVYFTRAAAIHGDSKDEASKHKYALALLGLWSCCETVNDAPNSRLSLQKIVEIPTEPSRGLRVLWTNSEFRELGALKVETEQDLWNLLRKYQDIWSLRYAPKPTEENCRKLSKDYDQLLRIQTNVKSKLDRLKKAEQNNARGAAGSVLSGGNSKSVAP